MVWVDAGVTGVGKEEGGGLFEGRVRRESALVRGFRAFGLSFLTGYHNVGFLSLLSVWTISKGARVTRSWWLLSFSEFLNLLPVYTSRLYFVNVCPVLSRRRFGKLLQVAR